MRRLPGRLRLACVYTGAEREIDCGTLLPVTARLPNDDLYQQLVARREQWADAGILSVCRIGDCLAPGTIAAAVYAGHRYARELGAPLDPDAVLPPIFELVEGMGRPIMDWLADAVKGRGLLKPEIVRALVPGQELFLQVTLGRTFENGRTVLVGILNDATELKTLEAQFVQSQKMQAIGQLAGGVAHDFNNLLTAISGHCDLLLLRHDPGDPEYADLIQISQNSNRAASLVGQLLAFSRKQNLKPQALDLRDTMLDLAHLLNRLIGERIQLDVTHAPGPQMIRADRRQSARYRQQYARAIDGSSGDSDHRSQTNRADKAPAIAARW